MSSMTPLFSELTLKRSRQFYSLNEQARRNMAEFEREYGKYLFVELDVEPIVPDDIAKFREWFDSTAVAVKKIKNDIAGGYGGEPIFASVDTYTTKNSIWESNVNTQLFHLFPELLQKLNQLPFYGFPLVRIWSSIRQVFPHRDEGSFFDFPNSFRSMLFDDNPSQTLFLFEDPAIPNCPREIRFLPSNAKTFAWNNLRVQHASFYRGFQKCLLILDNVELDLNRYANLLDRSIAKNGDSLFSSAKPISAFSKI